MNRIPRRSAAEEAEALLEAGRTEPALHYDVELGLARHHDRLRSDAPMPEWASTNLGRAATSSMPVAIKTLVSAVLIGALAVGAWYGLDRPQRMAAEVQGRSSAAQPARAAAPSVQGVGDSEAWLAKTPIPVPAQSLPSEPPARRTARTGAHDKRTPRSPRPAKEVASARATSLRSESTAAHPSRAAAAASQPTHESSAEPATGEEVPAAPERRSSTLERQAPEPKKLPPPTDDLVEMQEVATAERLLERSPERALALVRQGDRRFARGYFQQERAYIAIMALIRLGRIDEARSRAASFAERFPALPYGARIRSALEGRQAAAHGATSRDAKP